MRRAGRKKKPLTIQPIKCVVMLSSDEEHDCIAAEKKKRKSQTKQQDKNLAIKHKKQKQKHNTQKHTCTHKRKGKLREKEAINQKRIKKNNGNSKTFQQQKTISISAK